ncbi:FliA/WhiG family RNA polymerase sigma factor [Kosakonia quasisacchari]|uniref:FliA/WhiG family RNA polymerase sigma factor n=1 Tax=Kosakonia quasisacchari TaxID=2529380 RepID=A0A4R0GWA2_9ENTR|nr:FliA/WhiG family RNA polymerase sigma factor [Kosakonia quasisacchari]TCC00092.1 FliA/WhiG family RNA polymerase sigma factor [Kosakonia quasisacchari]
MMSVISTETITFIDEARYIRDYLPLVHKVMKQFTWQTSSVMDKDDMCQVALTGLLFSLRRYGQPDAKFAGYAAQRIRGAILDELRQQDWRPRRCRQKMHKLNDAIRELVRELGYMPNFNELSARLSITPEEYQHYLLLDSASELESLDNDVHAHALESRPLEDDVLNSRALKSAIANLTPREQRILELYYRHELSLKEIASILGLTEARVCQLNKVMVQKLRAFLTNEYISSSAKE